MSSHEFLFPPGQRYDCQCCGRCCPAYEIGVTAEEKARLVAQHWETGKALAGRPLFVERRKGTILALNERGVCLFLDEQNRCRIHGRFGEAAKPLGCRLYPFVLNPTGPEIRVSVRFDCPAVAANRGRPVAEHASLLRVLAEKGLPASAFRMAPPPFRRGRTLEWSYLTGITTGLLSVWAEKTLSVTRRVIASVTMTHLLRRVAVDKLENDGMTEFLSLARETAVKDARSDDLTTAPPPRKTALLFRQLLGLYGRRDLPEDLRKTAGRKPALSGARLNQSLRFVNGRGPVPKLQPDFPVVDFAAMEEPLGEPTGAAAEALDRFYRGKLNGMVFCGRPYHQFPFVDGLYSLWLTYPVVLWYARLFSRGEARSQVTATAVRRALQVVDWHHGRTPLFAARTERRRAAVLAGEDTLRGLVTWYGC